MKCKSELTSSRKTRELTGERTDSDIVEWDVGRVQVRQEMRDGRIPVRVSHLDKPVIHSKELSQVTNDKLSVGSDG